MSRPTPGLTKTAIQLAGRVLFLQQSSLPWNWKQLNLVPRLRKSEVTCVCLHRVHRDKFTVLLYSSMYSNFFILFQGFLRSHAALFRKIYQNSWVRQIKWNECKLWFQNDLYFEEAIRLPERLVTVEETTWYLSTEEFFLNYLVTMSLT